MSAVSSSNAQGKYLVKYPYQSVQDKHTTVKAIDKYISSEIVFVEIILSVAKIPKLANNLILLTIALMYFLNISQVLINRQGLMQITLM